MPINLFSINITLTPHFASSIVNKGFILLSHFCTRSRTGHVYHNNKQQQSTKTDLDTSGDLLRTHFRIKWQVGWRTLNLDRNFVFIDPVVFIKRVFVISIYLLSPHCTQSAFLWLNCVTVFYFPGMKILRSDWNTKVLVSNYSWLNILVNINIL